MENKKNITKANERKALEQIKQIVESIGGENSYVGMAFKGAFELAEENIKHDFWGAALDWQEEMKRQDGLMRQTEAELTKAKRDLEISEANAEDFYKRFREQEVRAIKAEEALAAKDVEIIKIKAKLYDLTVKE